MKQRNPLLIVADIVASFLQSPWELTQFCLLSRSVYRCVSPRTTLSLAYKCLRVREGKGTLTICTSTNQRWVSPLAWAASRGQIALVNYILDQRASVPLVQNDESAALFFACEFGHEHVARIMVVAGADIHWSDDVALRTSVSAGQTSCALFLLQLGDNAHDMRKRIKAFEGACRKGHRDLVEAILILGIDDTSNAVKTKALRNLLEWAPSLETMQVLLRHGADPNASIVTTACYCSVEALVLLLEYGARVDKHWLHALDRAQMLRVMFRSPTHTMTANDVKEAVRRHMQLCLPTNVYLCNVVRRNLVEGFNVLFENGADVHMEDDWPLREAASKGAADTVTMLLQNGANIHAKNDEALRQAARHGKAHVVEILLQHGANVHALDDEAIRSASTYKTYKNIVSSGLRNSVISPLSSNV